MLNNNLNTLQDLIASVLEVEKAYLLPDICEKYGLGSEDAGDPMRSKRMYISRKLAIKSKNELIQIGINVLQDYQNFALDEYITKTLEGKPKISQITRRKIIDSIQTEGDLVGKMDLIPFLKSIFPLDTMPSIHSDYSNATNDIAHHMLNNDDWDMKFLLDNYLKLIECSDKIFKRLIEQMVHPEVRDENDQIAIAEKINLHLGKSGYKLAITLYESGYPIYQVISNGIGVEGGIKQLIFAANGPKPEIIISDALQNEIIVTKNAEHCLVYREEIPIAGLMWSDLVKWWSVDNAVEYNKESARNLHSRLFESLKDSEPEQFLFNRYFKFFSKLEGSSLPALIPQVYFHYDPYTIRQLGGEKRVIRQRMDFLIFFSRTERVVIEIDGKHHYANDDVASPSKYAEMAKADRELRLAGYEIYRFGGSELVASNPNRVKIVEDFFLALFRKHRVLK